MRLNLVDVEVLFLVRMIGDLTMLIKLEGLVNTNSAYIARDIGRQLSLQQATDHEAIKLFHNL